MADLASRTHSYNTRQKYMKRDAHQRKERSFSRSFLFAWALSTLVARAQWAGQESKKREVHRCARDQLGYDLYCSNQIEE